jgi:hypothetical protein
MPSKNAAPVSSGSRLVTRFQAGSIIAAGCTVLIGTTALVGRAAGIEIIKSGGPNQVAIKADTSVRQHQLRTV